MSSLPQGLLNPPQPVDQTKDIAKSLLSGAAQGAASAPYWLGDMGNLANLGMQKGYEYYRDISGQPMSLYNENKLENTRPFYGSDEILKPAEDLTGLHPYQPQTTAGTVANIGGNLLGFGGAANAQKIAESPVIKALMGDERGMFGGVKAVNANLETQALAQKLSEQGADPKAIWKQTGWFQGPDKQWRFEIDDSQAVANPNATVESWGVRSPNGEIQATQASRMADAKQLLADGMAPNKVFKLTGFADHGSGLEDFYKPSPASAISHDALANAYPSLENTKFELMPDDKHIGGTYDDTRNTIRLVNTDNMKSYGLHELQHAIQDKEGFARGGSPDVSNGLSREQQFGLARQAYEKSNGLHGGMSDDELLSELFDTPKPATQAAPWDNLSDREKVGWLAQGRNLAYRNLAGETEARLVQARMNMTPEQRAASFPPDMYDVPADQQIVRNGGGVQMSQTPLHDTPEFKNWSEGAPVFEGPATSKYDGGNAVLQLYHGPKANWKGGIFNTDMIGTGTDAGNLGHGLYMTPHRFIADAYKGRGADTMSLYAKVKNPLELIYDENYPQNVNRVANELGVQAQPQWSGTKQTNPEFSKEFAERAQAKGHDAAIARAGNDDKSIVEMALYKPNGSNLKSVLNPGTFDPKDPNILGATSLAVPATMAAAPLALTPWQQELKDAHDRAMGRVNSISIDR